MKIPSLLMLCSVQRLNRKIEGEVAKIILKLNPIHVHKIAIDIPSGVLADGNIPENAVVFKADETLSLQFCKQSFCIQKSARILW